MFLRFAKLSSGGSNFVKLVKVLLELGIENGWFWIDFLFPIFSLFYDICDIR